MTEFNPFADDPYDRLGVSPDASRREIRIAAAEAKREYNPDSYPPGEKEAAREKIYRIREAVESILDDTETETATEETDTPRSISVSVEDRRVVEKSPLTVRVVTEAGEAVSGAIVTAEGDGVSTESGPVETGSDGEATVTPVGTGEATVRATTDVGDGDHVEDSVTVSVVPTVQLVLDGPDDPVEVGESVSFRVETADGKPVESATVEPTAATAGRRVSGTATTDETGEGQLSFDVPGTVEVRAAKSDSDVEYVSDTTTVSVDRRSVSLTLEYREELRVGERTQFRVTTEPGDEVVAGATVEFDGDRKTTDEDGLVEFIPSRDPLNVRVNAPDGDTRTFHPEEYTLSVERASASLRVVVDTDTVLRGQPATVRVETESGDAVEGAALSASPIPLATGADEETGGDGTATVSFDETGETELTASRPDDDRYSYDSGSARVEVMPSERRLDLEVSDSTVTPGSRLSVTVTDDGSPVEGATVIVEREGDERDRKTTNSEGVTRLALDSPGRYKLTATASGDGWTYDSTSERVYVESTEPATLSTDTNRAGTGERVVVSVTGERTGEPLERVRVRADNERTNDTVIEHSDRDGTVSFTFDEGGEWTFTPDNSLGDGEASAGECSVIVETDDIERPDGSSSSLDLEPLVRSVLAVAIVAGGVATTASVYVQQLPTMTVAPIGILVVVLSVAAYLEIVT